MIFDFVIRNKENNNLTKIENTTIARFREFLTKYEAKAESKISNTRSKMKGAKKNKKVKIVS